jgi:hypothetical protein
MVPLLTGLVLILGAGVGHGLWTNRWSTSNEPQHSADKVPGVSLRLGDWEGRDGPALEEDVRAIGQIVGYVNRAYMRADTQQVISMQILCGRPGPITAHMPDICLGGEGYVQVGALRSYSHEISSEQKVDFMVGQFQRTQEGGLVDTIRIFWSMSAKGDWKAPKGWYGRLMYGKYPALYKIYLQRRLASTDEPLDKDPILQFANFLIPNLQKTLFTEH